MSILKLSRLQSLLASFVVFAAVLGGSLWTVNHALTVAVQNVTEAANSTFTSALVNARWESLRPMLGVEQLAPDAKKNPRLPEIDVAIRSFARGTDLVKVKIYNAKGLTLYSSDPSQIGEDKSANLGFQHATKGRIASELTHRGKFGSFDGDLYNRNLVSSYVPVRGPQGVEAVVEVYADRTESTDAVERQMYRLAGSLGGTVALGFALVILLAYAGAAKSPAAAQVRPEKTPVNAAPAGLGDIGRELARSSRELGTIATGLGTAPLDEGQRQSVERLAAMARRASQQAEAFALHDRMQRGDAVTQRAPMDLQRLLEQVAKDFEQNARARNLATQVLVSQQLPKTFLGDEEKLRKLLSAVTGMLIQRAAEGVVQFKVQPSALGIQVDLISAATDAAKPQGVELLQANILAQAAGAALEVRESDADGDWLSISIRTDQDSAS